MRRLAEADDARVADALEQRAQVGPALAAGERLGDLGEEPRDRCRRARPRGVLRQPSAPISGTKRTPPRSSRRSVPSALPISPLRAISDAAFAPKT